jgi:FAD/FMN-containing dehydrogenase
MIAERALNPDGEDVVIDDEAILALAGAFRGEIIRPGDAGYDTGRKVWNGMVDRYPALILRALDTADVVTAVNFVRENDLLVAVRGGGHNVAGTAVVDGGVVIDLSRMRDVQVDPQMRIARAQGGANWGDVDRATTAHNLATPGGVVSETGIAGLTLGGGYGSMRRKLGLTIDNLLAVEIVTAAGEVLHASETEHPDLFWAVRGGGGNFGIVTSFEYRLHPVGPQVAMVATFHHLADAPALLEAWREYIADAPDEVATTLLFWGMPQVPGLEALHDAPIFVIAAVYAGDATEGERIMQPLRDLGNPFLDLSGRPTYLESQCAFDPFFPNGLHYYWKSIYMDSVEDDVLAPILARAAERPSPQTLIALRHLGGAIARVPEGATAYGHRSAEFNLSIDTTWVDPSENDRMVAWTKAFWSEMRLLTGGGVYVNFAGFNEDGEQLGRAIHGANYDQLVEVKRRYDPANLFRVNANIRP